MSSTRHAYFFSRFLFHSLSYQLFCLEVDEPKNKRKKERKRNGEKKRGKVDDESYSITDGLFPSSVSFRPLMISETLSTIASSGHDRKDDDDDHDDDDDDDDDDGHAHSHV